VLLQERESWYILRKQRPAPDSVDSLRMPACCLCRFVPARTFAARAVHARLAAFNMLLVSSMACAAGVDLAAGDEREDAALAAAKAPTSAARVGRIELRRQNTERGTPEESTRTTLRTELFLKGAVSGLRLDLPFPDEKADFGGDPFQPRLGDIKLRVNFRAYRLGETRLSSDVEMTFPTADSRVRGGGKYQLSAAVRSAPTAADSFFSSGHHRLRLEWSVRQTVSVAGDEDRTDVNNTKPEVGIRDSIGDRYWLKLTFKPTIDWVQDGKTGAVLELEGGWNASRQWRLSMKGGARLWDEGVPGIYGRRVELVAGRSF
jgi:hypothetical protein